MYSLELFGYSVEYELLYFSVIDNLDFFYFVRHSNWYGNGFVKLMKDLLCHLHWYEENLKYLYKEAPRFDANEKIKGNGFRSFILIFERCFSECYKFSKRVQSSRISYFFRADYYLKEGDCLLEMLSGLKPALEFLKKMLINNLDCHLLVSDKSFTAEQLILECAGINQLAFYGRFEGFYYCQSMRRILQGVGVIVATFSDLYQTSGGPISRAMLTVRNGLKYILNPELRALQIVNVAQNSSVEFLKSFWKLGESQFMTTLPRWICPKLQIREKILIPPEPIVMRKMHSDDTVVVPVPSSHIPPAAVKCLLLSAFDFKKKIFVKEKNKSCDKSHLSSSLLFHCHGGGFISQSPESHEIYLHHWAKDLNLPIFSVDYSLSPEAPFPRAVEEVLFAYAWALQNPDKLGWTGEKICFVGDSAGGNILLGIVFKTIALDIRKPDAVLCAYSPLILDMVPSPSRLLCWIDPLLPLGFMLSCLDAYAGCMLTDGNEYDDDEQQHNSSGYRSRKISSISEIFDYGLNFMKQSDWIDMEASDPPVTDEDGAFNQPNKSSELDDEKTYVHRFIEDCNKRNCFETYKESNSIKDHALFDMPYDIIFDLKSRCKKFAETSLKKVTETFVPSPLYQKYIAPFVPYNDFSKKITTSSPSKLTIVEKMKNLKLVTRNPFMSPLLISDDYLKEMPPSFFVSLNFDPCLDDTITFVKRLRDLNRTVELDVLDGLPHGFLNFLPFSQEAHDGSDLCVTRLKEAFSIA